MSNLTQRLNPEPSTMQASRLAGRREQEEAQERWNRCDVCGRFIAMTDFDRGAVRRCVTDDTEFSRETWETLCIEHGRHP